MLAPNGGHWGNDDSLPGDDHDSDGEGEGGGDGESDDDDSGGDGDGDVEWNQKFLSGLDIVGFLKLFTVLASYCHFTCASVTFQGLHSVWDLTLICRVRTPQADFAKAQPSRFCIL